MDVVKIQSLIAQNRVIKSSSTDLSNIYLQVGVYQAPNSRKASGDFNTYAPYAMSLQDIASGITCSPSNVQEIYVNGEIGNDGSGNGSVTCPYKSIAHALTFCTDNRLTYTLVLSCYTYTGAAAVIPGNVNIQGNGSIIDFNLTLGAVGLSGADIAPFYNDTIFKQFTFDLTPFLSANPAFNNCGITALFRTDTTSGNRVLKVFDSYISNFNVRGYAVFSNSTIDLGGTVDSNTKLILQGCIIDGTINLDAISEILVVGSLYKTSAIIMAVDATSIIRTDSSSINSGGTIFGIPTIIYLDNAASIDYNVSTASDWTIIPSTVKEGLDYLAQRGLSRIFAQTANSVSIANSVVEQTLIGLGVGSLTVPANVFQVGDSFQLNMSGHINSRNNDDLRIRVKSGSVVLADTGNINMPACTNQHFDLKINFTVRKIGSPGNASIASTVMFTYTKDASNAFEGENVSIVNNTTFNTTISNTLNITAQWDAADPLNSIYSELCTLFKTY